MMMLESLIRRGPKCPSARCFDALGRARRGNVAIGSSTGCSCPARALSVSSSTEYSCCELLNGTIVPDGNLRQSDCLVELSLFK